MKNINSCIFCKANQIAGELSCRIRIHCGLWYVVCHGCRARGPEKEFEDEAILAWNRGDE